VPGSGKYRLGFWLLQLCYSYRPACLQRNVSWKWFSVHCCTPVCHVLQFSALTEIEYTW
jgi:hypothetical protein